LGETFAWGSEGEAQATDMPALASACTFGEAVSGGEILGGFSKRLPGYGDLPAKVLFSACSLKAVVLFGSLAKEDNCVLKHFMVPFCSPEFCLTTTMIPCERY